MRPYYLRWLYFPLVGGRPEYFDACWRSPTSLLALRNFMSAAASPSFLFLPMSDWHARMQRTQHVASALAMRGHACYLLNPHLGRQYAQVYAADRQARAGTLGDNLTELHIRLPNEPVYHHRLLSASETRRLADAMAPLASARGVVQIVSFPTWGDLALRLRESHGWPIVYDCHDLLAGFPNVAPEIVDAEGSLMERADFVLFSSDNLRQTYAARASIRVDRMALLRNAVDARFIRSASAAPHSGRPIAGYVGALDRWFDIEAVRLSAQQNPQALFRLIGRIEHEPIRELGGLPNVEFTGEARHERLREMLDEFSIGLIPFVVNELTRAANPIKLYEYFSAGLPVVSARLPEVERYSDAVHLADSPASFAEQVERALLENDDALRKRRIEIAKSETWDARAGELLSIVGRLAAYDSGLTPP